MKKKLTLMREERIVSIEQVNGPFPPDHVTYKIISHVIRSWERSFTCLQGALIGILVCTIFCYFQF